MSWVLALLGFSALILLHEAGHFVVAKAVGMRVERFALFFGPLLFSVRRGETEYGIGSIPLGGYVRISGMALNEQLPDDVAARAYANQPVWKRVAVIAAGPLTNVALAFVILFAVFWHEGRADPKRPQVAAITKGSPATGRLQPKDEIVSVDGKGGSYQAITKAISAHACAGGAKVQGCKAARPARFVVRRDGRLRSFDVRPRYDTQTKPARPRVGFAVGAVSTPIGPVRAARSAVDGMWDVTHLTITTVGRLFTSSEARKQVSGPVGNYEVTRETIEHTTFQQTMTVLALISLSLAIVNLFPFLPLDGGHIFWATVEKLRGRATSIATMERASVVGVMLVLAVFAIGLVNDIGRIAGDGFGVR